MGYLGTKTPADTEFDNLKEEAKQAKFILVKMSDRKYEIHVKQYFRVNDIVVEYTSPYNYDRYSFSNGLRMIESLRKA